ncbi:MAG: class I tRNA ligase family protein, partial [Propioniciclava sp.]|nr:class I tRNA ligase family protein [Propioniciclava sp.]
AFDVQGGGSDLVFPHHEMSASQGRAATGQAFARAFVHGGMVGYEGEKMSKSKGNLVLVSKLRAAGVDPMAIRLVLLDHHYRSDWEYTDADLERATERLAAWRSIANNPTAFPATETVQAIRDALRDDLDAPAALAAVDTWVAASAAVETDETESVTEVLTLVDALLGVRV